ncbi:MAG TPA: NAD-dependent epimerase/dehydratase family protein, partial [Chloroflexota bacterium]|nr:NAD-dependent epimerase/dehydratase family protein [Chloroflexota bacterium]
NPIFLTRPSSDLSVLLPGAEVRAGTLDNPSALEVADVDTLIYCASMGFGHIPALLAHIEKTSPIRRAVFISTTAIFTTLHAASRGPRQAAEAAVEASALDWTILRPTMIYGTARDRNISRLLGFLRRWPIFPLCGNALWQPIHVEDLADAVISALDEPHTIHHAYNLAGAEALPFSELVRTAASAVNRQVLLVPVPLQAALIAARLTGIVRQEQVRRLAEDKAFSFAEAARDFGFAPRTFAAGVALEARLLGLAGDRRAQRS